MRGKESLGGLRPPQGVITPAYAGKSYKVHIEVHNQKVITPAYAGKRPPPMRGKGTNSDHPRLCGEKTKKILKQRYFFHQPASFSFSLQYT